MNEILHGDCLELMQTLPDNSVDSVVTDPPYELGFMGKQWDNSGIAYNVEVWKECLRVLKPGGHLLAFGGTRTYHRMACAIEDAGFEIRDMIEWCYGSGFPKSLNIGKAVDKLQGNEREDLGLSDSSRLNAKQHDNKVGGNPHGNGGEVRLTKGTSPYEGFGTVLKPSHEPICMARKPLSEKTVAENCLKWGTGGINIEQSRVRTEDQQLSFDVYTHLSYLYSLHCNASLLPEPYQGFGLCILSELNSYSSFDKDRLHNVFCLDDSLNLDVLSSQKIVKSLLPNANECVPKQMLIPDFPTDYPACFRFYGEQLRTSLIHDKATAQQLTDVLYGIYFSLSEQGHSRMNQHNDHPSNLNEFLQFVAYLFILSLHKDTKYLSHPQENNARFPSNFIHDGSEEVTGLFPENKSTASVWKGFSGDGSNEGWKRDSHTKEIAGGFNDSGSAARFFYCAKASKADRDGSTHPTVKPTKLMRYLCRLVTPPGGTVLDPFMGSGTTGKAAKLEGFSFIGIELEKEYFEIAKQRINKVQERLF